MKLPKPGGILLLDFRPCQSTHAIPPSVGPVQPIKLLQWNIERGYKLDAIIEELKQLDADVVALQEVDIHNERSGFRDTGQEIAQALGLHYAFICEFEELHSPLREASTQGGGVHGNAILSKFELLNVTAVEHTCHPVDWNNPTHPLAQKEPRNGRRLTLAAQVATPQGPLLVYSAHLEVFCGMLARMHQASDIFRHARQHSPDMPCQALLGDLNTMGNGIARLSPHYCTDATRWATLGCTEGEVWQTHVFGCTGDTGRAADSQPPINTWLRSYGMPEQVCRDVVNPGFQDPWDARTDFTLDNPAYRLCGCSLMTGKLDWVLLRRCKVVSKRMGNEVYDKSDHKWLMVEVQLQQDPS